MSLMSATPRVIGVAICFYENRCRPPIGDEASFLLLFVCTRVTATTVGSGSLSGSGFDFLDPGFVALLCFNLGTGIMTPSSVVAVALEMMPGLTVEVEGLASID